MTPRNSSVSKQLAAAMQQLQARRGRARPGIDQRRADDSGAAGCDLRRQSQCAAAHLQCLEAQAEAKQQALAREKQKQDAINSDTVAIDFAHSGELRPPSPNPQTAAVLAERAERRLPRNRKRPQP